MIHLGIRGESEDSRDVHEDVKAELVSQLSHQTTTMRAARTAEQALRLAATRPTQQYVCLTCRAQAARQLHTSTPRLADVPFYKRLQESLFGSKESKEAERSREEKQKRRLEEVAERDNSAGLEVTTDKRGRQYEVAAIVDPTINRDYVQATSWDGLESVGSVEWVKQRADRGEQYVGFAPKKRVELKGGQWEMLLHHIAVEVLVLERAGRDVEQVCWPRVQGGMGSWVYTRNATVQPSSDGGVTLGFTQAEAEQQILQAIPDTTPDALVQDAQALFSEVEGAVAEEGGLPEYANGGGKRTQPVWMDFSLTDPTLKLAVRTSPYLLPEPESPVD